jgi:hypothetical protein
MKLNSNCYYERNPEIGTEAAVNLVADGRWKIRPSCLISRPSFRVCLCIYVSVICLLVSCQKQTQTQEQAKPAETEAETESQEQTRLVINFNLGQTRRYRFLSSRDITIQWSASKGESTISDSVSGKSTESMEAIVAFTPEAIDPNGQIKINAKCESVQVKRSDGSQSDAASFFAGKSYSFTVDSAGKIIDYSQLTELTKQAGLKAFVSDSNSQRIKEPDMIGDYIATQWFLWEPVSSIPNTSQGVKTGQSWQSKLSVPTPMVSRLARNAAYKLEKISKGDKGTFAVISSSFSPADSVPESWPIPYTGSFLMKGKFGLLGNYKFLGIQGQGEVLININLGRIEQNYQQYKMTIQASMPMGLNVNPEIIINQNLTMIIIDN